jgi:hypothetical protein
MQTADGPTEVLSCRFIELCFLLLATGLTVGCVRRRRRDANPVFILYFLFCRAQAISRLFLAVPLQLAPAAV